MSNSVAGLFRLLKLQYNPPMDPKGVSLAGKVVLLTGATSGLGFQAAIKILKLGADTLIIGSRSLERGQEAKLAIEKAANRRNVIKVWQLEMDRFRSVREFVDRINKDIDHLDIAFLNAGLMNRAYKGSHEGWEESLQVNTLSTSMLALLLIPKLKKSASAENPAHLIAVSSQQFVRVQANSMKTDDALLPYLNEEANFQGRTQYGISKLLLEFVMKKIANLSRNEDGSHPLIVNTVSPGLCISALGRQYNSWYEKCAMWFMYKLFARTPEQGSRCIVSAALQGVESQGKCWRGDGYLE
jgi:NAD(P)-dependent dehydrogenase (short-subunit alcohol dehydrogenase family)